MTRMRSILLGAGTSVVLVLTACGSGPAAQASNSPAAGGNSAAAGGNAGGPGVVAVRSGTAVATVKQTDDLTFVPPLVDVKVGDVVDFTNAGTVVHNVNFPYAGLGSPTMKGGSSFLVKFTTPGTYPFICSFHVPGMAGTITVR